MNRTVKYRRKDHYVQRKVGENEVLISIGANIADFNGYIRLNGSALTLWNRLAEPADRADLAEALRREYGLEKAQAEADAGEFLQYLLENRMVEAVEEQDQ